MKLTDLQQLFIGGLKLCGLKDDDIIAVMLLLQDEELQWQMAEHLESVIDDPPSRSEVFNAAAEIAMAHQRNGEDALREVIMHDEVY